MHDEKIARRFWSKVALPNQEGCMEWMAYRADGYGRIGIKGRMARAHRVAYELLVGPVPEGKELDHICKNKACVNVLHLEPVSHRENMLRAKAGEHQTKKTACPKNHPYEGDNLYVNPQGARICRACRRAAQAKRL